MQVWACEAAGSVDAGTNSSGFMIETDRLLCKLAPATLKCDTSDITCTSFSSMNCGCDQPFRTHSLVHTHSVLLAMRGAFGVKGLPTRSSRVALSLNRSSSCRRGSPVWRQSCIHRFGLLACLGLTWCCDRYAHPHTPCTLLSINVVNQPPFGRINHCRAVPRSKAGAALLL